MNYNPKILVHMKDGTSFESTKGFQKSLERVQGHLIDRFEEIGGNAPPVAESTGDAARIAFIQSIVKDNAPIIDKEAEIEKIMDVKGLAPLQKQLEELGITKAEMRDQGIRKKRDLAEKIFELTNK